MICSFTVKDNNVEGSHDVQNWHFHRPIVYGAATVIRKALFLTNLLCF
jgi:hypothetical protein